MERMQLVVESRDVKNKGSIGQLRREGRIPAILYGTGSPSTISVDAKEWMSRFRNISNNTIIDLKHGKKEHKVLIKDTQDDILTDSVYHIDFYAIHAGRKLHTRIPIHLEGTPKGVREGGILENKISELEVVCLPKDLPSNFSVNIDHLEVGESLHVREISIPKGIEVRTDLNLTVVVVSLAGGEVETDQEGIEGDISIDADSDTSDHEGSGKE